MDNYCKHCGSRIEAGSHFCKSCGRPVNNIHERAHVNYHHTVKAHEKEPFNKLMQELAYTGTLFWLPILLCPNEKNAKYHANQGLWVLICSIVLCTVIRILSSFNHWAMGSAFGIVTGALYSLAFMAFLFAMLFLLFNVVQRAILIHNNEDPKPILFFEKFSIIK